MNMRSAVCRGGLAVNEEARFRDNLAVRLKDCRGRARDAIRSYRLHGNVVRVSQEVGIVILSPCGSYPTCSAIWTG